MRQLKILFQITKRSPSLEKYFQEIDKVQLITVDEEVNLTRRIREGDLLPSSTIEVIMV
jgi:RNA polymerase primary sigma factor